MSFLIYLAGPISGLTHEECTGWRQYIIDNLPDRIEALSPMRSKPYLKDSGTLTGAYENWPLSSQRGIYARDRYDCTRSDAIIVNLLNATTVSIGTVMEIAWAADHNIPVVLIIDPNNIHQHPMILEACPFVVSEVDEALAVVSALLLPDSH